MNKDDNLFSPRFSKKDVTIHKKQRIFKKYFAIDEYELSYPRFDGKEQAIVQREIFERDSNAVAILAYDIAHDEVALIEQFRPGALSDPITPWLIEIVAGIIDKGEQPIESAIREVKEEIGLKIEKDDLYFFSDVYPSPGGISEKVSIYIANANLEHLSNHGGLDCENEDIRVFKVSLDDAYNQVIYGRINNSAAMIALMFLKHHKEEIVQHFATR